MNFGLSATLRWLHTPCGGAVERCGDMIHSVALIGNCTGGQKRGRKAYKNRRLIFVWFSGKLMANDSAKGHGQKGREDRKRIGPYVRLRWCLRLLFPTSTMKRNSKSKEQKRKKDERKRVFAWQSILERRGFSSTFYKGLSKVWQTQEFSLLNSMGKKIPIESLPLNSFLFWGWGVGDLRERGVLNRVKERLNPSQNQLPFDEIGCKKISIESLLLQ